MVVACSRATSWYGSGVWPGSAHRPTVPPGPAPWRTGRTAPLGRGCPGRGEDEALFVAHGGGEPGQLQEDVHQLLVRTAAERDGGEALVDRAGAFEREGLPVEDGAEDLGEDVVEHRVARQLHEREAQFLTDVEERGRQRGQVRAHLHAEPGEPAPGEDRDEAGEGLGVVAHGVGGGEQELPAAHPADDVGDLHDVDDPDGAARAALPRDEPRPGERGQRERVPQAEHGARGRGGTGRRGVAGSWAGSTAGTEQAAGAGCVAVMPIHCVPSYAPLDGPEVTSAFRAGAATRTVTSCQRPGPRAGSRRP
ncbi:hypothetical protein GA0115246_106133 [Streptomyces sp. SolWspMP-sol7th]|nr:hypothetical protein GA0115246_106133 [Streptomyces sp. SolWspMP-sol7th]